MHFAPLGASGFHNILLDWSCMLYVETGSRDGKNEKIGCWDGFQQLQEAESPISTSF